MSRAGIVRTSVVVVMLVLLCAAAGAEDPGEKSGTEIFRFQPRFFPLQELADALGVDVEEVRDALSPLANLRRLAEEQGVPLEDLRQVLADRLQELREELFEDLKRDPTVRSRASVPGQRVPTFGVRPYAVRPYAVRPFVARPYVRAWGMGGPVWQGPVAPYRVYRRSVDGSVLQAIPEVRLRIMQRGAFPPVVRWNTTREFLRPRISWEHGVPPVYRRSIEQKLYPHSEEGQIPRRFRPARERSQQAPEASSDESSE